MTRLSRKFTSAESTLAAGRSCTGSRTFFTIEPLATIDAAPPSSELEKNVHGAVLEGGRRSYAQAVGHIGHRDHRARGLHPDGPAERRRGPRLPGTGWLGPARGAEGRVERGPRVGAERVRGRERGRIGHGL